MKKGWFVTSGYFSNAAVQYAQNSFCVAFEKHGIHFVPKLSNEILLNIDEKGNICFDFEKPDFVLFWDKDVTCAKMLEKSGIKVFNNSLAIELCDDKIKTMIALSGQGLAMPKTVFAPLVYANKSESNDTFLNNVMKVLDFPIVVKEACGSFGWQVYLAEDFAQLRELRQKLQHIPHLYQQFISSSKGRDVRIVVIGGKYATHMTRKNENDFRANVELGGVACFEKIDDSFIEVAEKACKILKLDYAGVDLLVGDRGQPLLCEVNSNAYTKGLESCTGVNVADKFVEYVLSCM